MLAAAKHWLSALIQDPDGSPSSARVIGVLAGLAGVGIAIAGMALNREQAATVAALMGGGAGSLLVRRRSTGEAE